MLSEYLIKKLKIAKYKTLEDGSCFGAIPGLRGVWANAKNLRECKKELGEVLEEWMMLKIRNKENIPGFEIKIDRRELVRNA